MGTAPLDLWVLQLSPAVRPRQRVLRTPPPTDRSKGLSGIAPNGGIVGVRNHRDGAARQAVAAFAVGTPCLAGSVPGWPTSTPSAAIRVSVGGLAGVGPPQGSGFAAPATSMW